jgi:RNA polymerase sigma factor (sigma-70 family)
MARHSVIPPESFEEILAWLDPDREVAATMYVQLRHDLEKIFKWRGCSDPEGLTDEAFDRVAKKITHLRQTFKGNPKSYFLGVAQNLIREDVKKVKTQGSLEGLDPPDNRTTEPDEAAGILQECFESCLQELSRKKRELILSYYAKEKQAKIDHRSELAKRLDTSVNTLRVRVYRIRQSLEECIERCRKNRARQK